MDDDGELVEQVRGKNESKNLFDTLYSRNDAELKTCRVTDDGSTSKELRK